VADVPLSFSSHDHGRDAVGCYKRGYSFGRTTLLVGAFVFAGFCPWTLGNTRSTPVHLYNMVVSRVDEMV
jgi:hypothetical protein